MSDDPYFRRWSPELRRAVMKVRPELFTWPPAERERYGASIPDEDAGRLDQALLQELFGEAYATPEEATRAVGDLPPDLLDRWNGARLPLIGIGEDAFFLNEPIPEGHTLLDVPTLGALDELRQRHPAADEAARADRPCRGCFYWDMARLFVDDRLTYATLSMAAGYVYDALQELAFDTVQACVPYTYVPGADHGKRDGDMWIWDKRKEAGGQEALADELEWLALEHARERCSAVEAHLNALGRGGVYVLDARPQDESEVQTLDFVFTDVRALEEIRFASFVGDCRRLERPVAELGEIVTAERAQMEPWIRDQHRHLLETFDPTVVRFEKRRRIRVHKDGLDEPE